MIFNFFKKKECISCYRLEYGLNIYHMGLSFCDMDAHLTSPLLPLSKLRNGRYDFDDFFKKREKLRKLHRKGIINDRCIGCYNLEKKEWNSEQKIKHIDISANLRCNSDCIYCFSHKKKILYNKIPDLPVLDLLKNALKKNMIDSNCEIQIGGGEPVIHKEFEQIMQLILDNGFKNINIYSSGIQYSPSIERALRMDACNIYVSLDAGNRELYKKIKNKDEFDNVIHNLKKYCNAQNINKKAVCIKYIIIPEVNDKKENLISFFDIINEIGVKSISIDIEKYWYQKNKDKKEALIPYIELMKYTQKYTQDNNIKLIWFPTAMLISKDYSEMLK